MRFLGLLLGTALILVAGVGHSQSPPDRQAEFKAAFEETLRKPNDPPTLLRFAEIAVQVGDLEAAISALERLLLIDGDQPRVKLELGVLYYRLGSYEAARSYLESARASARATQEVKDRATQFIAQVDSRTGKSQFTGDLFLGLRHSTNANSGPIGLISSAGSPTIADPTVSSRPDWSALAVATLRHRYDLGRQDGGAFETDFTAYKSRQFQVSEAHVLFFDLVFGPKLEPFGGWLADMAVKPFFMGRYISMHDLPTYWGYGTGLEASGPLHEQIRGALTVFGRRRDFINNADSAINDRSSGNELVSTLEFRVELTPYMTMSLNGNVTRYVAQVHSESFVEYGFGGGMSVRFTDPIGLNGRLWSVTGSGSLQMSDYDQPDVSIEPNVRRHQVDLNLSLVLAVPLDSQLTVIAQAAYTNRHASVNNYAYNAFTSLIGLGWRF